MKAVRQLLKRSAARAGYEIRRKPLRLAPDARYGLNLLGCLTEHLLSEKAASELLLLQVGANDGKDEDLVHDLLERHAIPAVLCEPLPDTFERLAHTYSGFDHVRLARCAIASHDGSLELFRISPKGGAHQFSKIASFDRDHVEQFRLLWGLPPDSVVSEIVPCMTVESLLTAYGHRTVDVAVVDTEGMDHVVCSQILDLAPSPSILQFEYSCSPIDSVVSLMERLTTLGYHFSRSGLNITAAKAGVS